mmetsp:Transcript_108150/g.305767  ORF Transcript_108150/g.305767 Transcript_108150/m.305767 type:complete len:273 (-) Transcript_108150:178-996(-)
MGSSMWGYHMQHACRRMVEAYEEQRGGQRYTWVVFARADLYWVHEHPPLGAMDPGFVYVPYGQDNSHYFHGPLPGLNDRHAVVPRPLLGGYFGRWEALGTGAAWRYLQVVAEGGDPINTEQYLLLHLRANGVPVRRFPPVAFTVHCAEGPQCQHLYRATNIGRQQWTQTAKYFTELIEVRRTINDGLHNVNRHKEGWIWAPLKPPYPLNPGSWERPRRRRSGPVRRPPEPFPRERGAEPWELQGLDLVCCLSRSGPVSCRRWDFLRRCHCLA